MGSSNRRHSSYSGRQKAILRDALLAYRRYTPGASPDGGLSWAQLGGSFDYYTDIVTGKDTLRQFAEGEDKNAVPTKYRELSDETLDGLVLFLTHPDVGLLTREDLDETQSRGLDAPFRLLQYLDFDFDSERVPPPANLEGTYRWTLAEKDQFSAIDLTLLRSSGRGLIEVAQIQEFFDPDIEERFDYLSEIERVKQRRARTLHAGWAILSPEDNLFFFLKNDRGGANLYYFTLASDLTHVPDVPVTALALLHHDYPLEPDETDSALSLTPERIAEEIAKNVRCFKRVQVTG